MTYYDVCFTQYNFIHNITIWSNLYTFTSILYKAVRFDQSRKVYFFVCSSTLIKLLLSRSSKIDPSRSGNNWSLEAQFSEPIIFKYAAVQLNKTLPIEARKNSGRCRLLFSDMKSSYKSITTFSPHSRSNIAAAVGIVRAIRERREMRENTMC